MRAFTFIGTSTSTLTMALVLALSCSGVMAGTAAAAPGSTRVPLQPFQRRCGDFGRDGITVMMPQVPQGTGLMHVHTSGSQVIADIQLVDPPQPGTHFDVELIQAPRSTGCAPGQPGIAFGGLDTDAAGVASVTLQDTLRPDTTGVWVSIYRPNPHSQNPAEFYSSEFVAPV